MDTMANDMRALPKAIMDRLDVFATELIARLISLYEASFPALKTEEDQLKTELMGNVNATVKVAADLDAPKTKTVH